jgi:CubicO group peptidase (beta-lactamase class C family)
MRWIRGVGGVVEKRAVGVFVGVFVVLGALLVGGAGAQEAGSPVLSLGVSGPVGPGTDIVVTLSGSVDGYHVITQCDTSGNACERRGAIDASGGAGQTTIRVRRTLLGSAYVDCARRDCVIRAQSVAAGGPSVSAPIEIDPTVAVVRPTIAADPSVDLVDRELISISGSGFEPDQFVQIFQCSLLQCIRRPGYGFAGPDGSFSEPARLRVSRDIDGIDCLDVRCYLLAFAVGIADHTTAAAISFDAAVPPAPEPSVTVDPVVGLRDGQTVMVTGTGFLPDEYVGLVQCGVDPGSNCRSYTSERTDADGAFTADFVARRRIGLDDCVDIGCVLRVSAEVAELRVAVSFDDSVPPPPLPTVTVEPSSDLVDHQVLTAEINGVAVGDFVAYRQCVVDGFECRYGPGIAVDEVPFPLTPAVVRDLGAIDCADVACELIIDIYQDGNSIRLAVPLDFDPDAPRADPPTMRILPAVGLWDGQRVDVRIAGLLAGDFVMVGQCEAGTQRCGPLDYRSGDATGSVSTRFAVTADLPISTNGETGESIDCRVVACSFVLFDAASLPIASVSLGFVTAPPPGAFYPAQLECVAWPTDGWSTGEVPAGVDPAELDAAIAEMLATDTASVVVIHGGALVGEGYDPGFDSTTSMYSASVSKTFTGTVIGMLVDEGLLDLDAPAPVPEWSEPGDPRGAITLRHLMNMAAGLEWREDYSFGPDNDILKMIASPDAANYAASKPLEVEPGTRFLYSTGTTQILARIISDTLNAYGPDLRAELDTRLFDVLGQTEDIRQDALGAWLGGAFTSMSTRDFAKLGLLHLRGGVWEDSQLVSPEWIDFMHAPSPAYGGYAGQIWRRGGFVEMVGLYGQKVTVRPDLDLVVASNTPIGGSGAGTDRIVDLFESAAPASCSGEPVVVDDEASVAAGGSVLVDVLANDPGADHELRPDTLTVVSAPEFGAADVAAGAIRYTPTEGFVGTDSFSYLVCTTAPYCAEAIVSVEVTP